MSDELAELWAVSIRGPDDLIAAVDANEAHHIAHAFNHQWCRKVQRDGLHKFDPHMWASPVIWPHAAEGHAADLADPSSDYLALIVHAGRRPALSLTEPK